MKSKILIARAYGTPDVLEFLNQELPPLAPGMARIEVKAAGINPIDARRMTGEFKHAPLPQAFGTEFAGVIAELPAGTTGWKVGDEVLGSGAGFTHATIIDVPVANLVARPAGMDWAVAGSIAGAAQTAVTILNELGDIGSLLIHGASGGVGSITIQLARARGIEVVATASAANQDYVRNLGAIPIVYGPGLIERLKAVHPAPFDASIDMSGSDDATAASLALVKPSGIIGSIAGKPATSPRVRAIWVKRSPENPRAVVEGIASGKLSWDVSRSTPFAKAAEAYAAILTGHTRG
ncbi:MAG TPA: NADP-dependent oxidoreductase, partial [Devosia sp.]|nr:NADP-dependent oxidoreductase [Devosia sp.]